MAGWGFSKWGFGPRSLQKSLDKKAFGTKDEVKQIGNLTPEQEQLMSLINEGLTSGEGPFGELFGNFDQDKFDKGVANPAIKNFQEQILPQLQEKFLGGGGAQGSGFRRASLKAGVDLQDKLAQLMYTAQQDQGKNKLSGIQTALGVKGFENLYKPGDPGLLNGFLQGASKGAGQAVSAAVVG
jgi:hypothetical protein